MKTNSDFMQAAVRYFIVNSATMGGALAQDNYFTYQRASDSGGMNSEGFLIYHGNGLDVLTQVIHDGKFYNGMVPAKPEQVCNPNNGGLSLVREGDRISGANIQLVDGRVQATVVPATQYKYLDSLRTADGFKQSAELLGFDDDLETIVEKLFTKA